MSTKAIKAVLMWAQRQAREAGDGSCWNQCIDALGELAEIQKVAATISGATVCSGLHRADVRAAMGHMDSIAKENA